MTRRNLWQILTDRELSPSARLLELAAHERPDWPTASIARALGLSTRQGKRLAAQLRSLDGCAVSKMSPGVGTKMSPVAGSRSFKDLNQVNRTTSSERNARPVAASRRRSSTSNGDLSWAEGVLAALDAVRRKVETDSRVRLGPISRRAQTFEALAELRAEGEPLERIEAVAERRARDVAARKLDPRLWRFLLTGAGYWAACDALERDRELEARRVQRREAETALDSAPVLSPEQLAEQGAAALAQLRSRG